ncbi:putative negative transcriptional regulator [Podospora aff. communis PSN243]|uniref:Negative transcriptional regulator n=1 Tax=Podospora aff. communis PSN243 TaxID=3040156 RepID=A0AAV9G5V2_9PEZI|nr:putative negative transcriptional regulator [Podospora aff. communis PSN243]
MSKTLLITGATGKQGGAVIDALLDLDKDGSQFTILALTRDTSSASAKRLASRGNIQLVQGDLNDVPALLAEAKRLNSDQPPWGVYSVQASLGPGVTVEGEITQGKALIDGCVDAGIKHFVYSSVERGGDAASWDNPTPIPHFQTKQVIEQHLRSVTAAGEPGATMGWTILRPVAFMDNLEPGMKTKVFIAALWNHLGDRNKSMQWVATADIGVFAAKAFSSPAEWNHRAVGIAGDELTMEQLSASFARATGSPAPVTYWPLGSLLTTAVQEVRLMIGWFASSGYKADIAARRRDHPGLLTMEEWLPKSSFATKQAPAPA